MKVFLDIETLPPDIESAVTCQKIARCTEEEFRALALDGNYGRVLAVGIIIEDESGQVLRRGVLGRDRATMRFHVDELRTLRAFWKLMDGFDPGKDIICGHNIMEFDLPFIERRSVIHRVRPTVKFCFARYRSRPICDTMREWAHWSWKQNTSLDELAVILGLESPKQDGMNGSHVYDMFNQGRHQEIADYCLRDVECTRTIYYRMNFLGEPVS